MNRSPSDESLGYCRMSLRDTRLAHDVLYLYPSDESLGYCRMSLRDTRRYDVRTCIPSDESLGYCRMSLRDTRTTSLFPVVGEARGDRLQAPGDRANRAR